jgi:hypothetical protein
VQITILRKSSLSNIKLSSFTMMDVMTIMIGNMILALVLLLLVLREKMNNGDPIFLN